ncbi:Hypothetical protein NTJ_02953 [Nesidiocoris tenuis]|uniref:Uncharacterized protein n=1 Tax=Nesidiocoris tenuis TaxID=355587 RepID=A0ABN7ACX0_9HEMI|nr:Hypothetical protein NTJ_02953 [Nesidiocoris tenuis]
MSVFSSIALLLIVTGLHISFAEDELKEDAGKGSSLRLASLVKRSLFHANNAPNSRLRVGRSAMAYPPMWGPMNYRFGDSSEYVNYAGVPFDNERRSWSSISGQKREGGLIPFPRVGRSGNGPKRNGAGTSGALWFGPRLGKRDFEPNARDAVDEFDENKIAMEDITK